MMLLSAGQVLLMVTLEGGRTGEVSYLVKWSFLLIMHLIIMPLLKVEQNMFLSLEVLVSF